MRESFMIQGARSADVAAQRVAGVGQPVFVEGPREEHRCGDQEAVKPVLPVVHRE